MDRRNLLIVVLSLTLAYSLFRLGTISQRSNRPDNNESTFSRKQECAKYLPRLQKEAGDVDASGYYTVQRLFYSQRENSCLYVLKGVHSNIESYALIDALSNTTLLSSSWDYRDLDAAIQKYDKFMQSVKEWEE